MKQNNNTNLSGTMLQMQICLHKTVIVTSFAYNGILISYISFVSFIIAALLNLSHDHYDHLARRTRLYSFHLLYVRRHALD